MCDRRAFLEPLVGASQEDAAARARSVSGSVIGNLSKRVIVSSACDRTGASRLHGRRQVDRDWRDLAAPFAPASKGAADGIRMRDVTAGCVADRRLQVGGVAIEQLDRACGDGAEACAAQQQIPIGRADLGEAISPLC